MVNKKAKELDQVDKAVILGICYTVTKDASMEKGIGLGNKIRLRRIARKIRKYPPMGADRTEFKELFIQSISLRMGMKNGSIDLLDNLINAMCSDAVKELYKECKEEAKAQFDAIMKLINEQNR